MRDSTTQIGKYIPIWQKYKPVILSLMIAAEKEPQEYKMSSHEFRDINLKKKTGYSFSMRVYQNKSITEIKTSLLAKDLLSVLQNSNKATELLATSIYEFELDKGYILHIHKPSE